MPLSIKTAQEKLGIHRNVSDFIIPLGATVNMDGTALYECVAAIFLAVHFWRIRKDGGISGPL